MIPKTFLLCACFLACRGFAQLSQQRVDSLKNVLQQHTTRDSSRVLTLIRYAEALFYVQPDSSLMNYADEALQIAKERKWNMGIANSLELKAVVYNFFWADPVKALECYQKALKMNERIGNKEFQFTLLVDIGVIHSNLKEFEEALRYFNEAYAIMQQLKTQKNEDQLLLNMAQAYSGLKKNTKAEELYTKSIALAENSGNVKVVANALCSRGFIYRNEKKPNAAKSDLEKGIALAEKYNMTLILVEGLINLAEVDTDLKNYAAAEQLAQKALPLARQMNMRQLETGALETLADVYSATGNAKKAVAYYQQYKPMHDSLLSDETRASLARMEMQYAFDRKQDSAKAVNDKQQALAAAKLQRQHIVNNSLMGGAGVLLLAGFSSFVFYKRRRDAEGQKQKAEFETQVVGTEMKALRAQMNPHFVVNSLESIRNFVRKNDKQEAEHYLVKFSNLMRFILYNSTNERISLAQDLNALEWYLEMEALQLNGRLTYEITVDDAVDKEAVAIQPLILQPFVENSIKHGIGPKEGKGTIRIGFSKEGEVLACFVEDDGIGRAKAALLQTVNKKKGGKGIELTKERILIMNRLKPSAASLRFCDLEEGLRVEVRLPLTHLKTVEE